jgi:hypothetical protein
MSALSFLSIQTRRSLGGRTPWRSAAMLLLLALAGAEPALAADGTYFVVAWWQALGLPGFLNW